MKRLEIECVKVAKIQLVQVQSNNGKDVINVIGSWFFMKDNFFRERDSGNPL
jgi:hypothetical protein